MKILSFLATDFGWQPFRQTLPEVPECTDGGRVSDALVAFLHVEAEDMEPDARKRAFKRTLKHLKWQAGKVGYKTAVLHSFAHLGGSNAAPAFAQAFLEELAERLTGAGYTVRLTPFGYFCSWDIKVRGESLAKVFKTF